MEDTRVEWTFPLAETYWAFGDGSESKEGALYGFVLVPESEVQNLQSELGDLKVRFNGTRISRIHCRELFAGDRRSKSAWAHLDSKGCGQLISEALKLAEKTKPKYLCTFWPRAHFPRKLRLRGKEGHSDLVHDIDDKWMVLWSYLHTAVMFDPKNIDEPPDPAIYPRPKNLPYWRFVGKRNERGPLVSRVLLDQDTTKTTWFSKSFQWGTIAREVMVETPRGKSVLPIDSSGQAKELVDIADILVYTIYRDLAGRPLPTFVTPENAPLLNYREKLPEELVLS